MSTFEMPANLSRRGRSMLALAFTVIDDRGDVALEGDPPSAMTTLMKVTGHTRQNVWASLRDLRDEGLAKSWKQDGGLRVRVNLDELHVEGACIECGSPSKGTGRWCARCKQIFGRDDRAWQVKALELHDKGLTPTRIAVKLDRPLYVASNDDGRDAHGGAVVPFLLGKGLLGPEWATRLREARRGASVSDEE